MITTYTHVYMYVCLCECVCVCILRVGGGGFSTFGSSVLFDVLRLIAHVHFKRLMNQVYTAAWSAMKSNRYINPLHPIADTFIAIISESATITAGSTGMFVCVAYGYPVPSLTWSRGETLLSNNSQSTIYERQVVETQSGETFLQSILVICSLTQDDAAQYNCSASNNISSTSASFNLTVNSTYINTLKVITVIRWCLTETLYWALQVS